MAADDDLIPYLANFHIALVCAVLCAAALPSRDRRSDVVIGLALLFAFATSGVAVAVAAACAARRDGPRPRRALGRHARCRASSGCAGYARWVSQPRAPDRPSIVESLGDVVEGAFESFSALTWNWPVGGAVLLAGWVALLVHRVRTDRPSSFTRLAWAAGLVVWWAGLVWSRAGAADGANGRYDYVGAVFILLSVLPAERAEWLTSPKARWTLAVPRWRSSRPSSPSTTTSSGTGGAQGVQGGESRDRTVRAGGGRAGRPDPPATPEMAGITVRDYQEKVVPRYGSPIDLSAPPDEAIIERGGLQALIVGPAPTDDVGCASGP